MNQSLIRELVALCASGFTGSITLHVERGTVKKCENRNVWTPPAENGVVDISEVTKVDSRHG